MGFGLPSNWAVTWQFRPSGSSGSLVTADQTPGPRPLRDVARALNGARPRNRTRRRRSSHGSLEPARAGWRGCAANLSIRTAPTRRLRSAPCCPLSVPPRVPKDHAAWSAPRRRRAPRCWRRTRCALKPGPAAMRGLYAMALLERRSGRARTFLCGLLHRKPTGDARR